MITTFREQYNFLSNFASVNIEYGDTIFPSVEHYYVAMKTLDEDERLKISKMKAGEAKRYGRTLDLRGDWNIIKLDVMEYGLRKKFSQEPFKSQLLETGEENIQEGNFWQDEFWGVNLKKNPNIGENHLGRLLMKIREEL